MTTSRVLAESRTVSFDRTKCHEKVARPFQVSIIATGAMQCPAVGARNMRRPSVERRPNHESRRMEDGQCLSPLHRGRSGPARSRNGPRQKTETSQLSHNLPAKEKQPDSKQTQDATIQ